jgi:predicted TIM-barrel fold metal-dependent hydrolase
VKKIINYILALSVLVFIYGCGGGIGKKQLPKPSLATPGFIIDDHIHYEGTDEWEKSFLTNYEKFNAIGCILVDMNVLERGIKFAKEHPDRAIPYAAIEIDSPTVLKDIQRAYDMGYKGLGEVFATGQWNYDDPKYDPIWALAEKLGMPVAPHTGILSNGLLSRMEPGYLGTICVKFPNLYIHAAHFGNPWYNEAGEVARRNKNLYFDMTGSSLIKKFEDPWYWEEYLWWTPYLGKPHMPKDAVPAFEKIVFGTDQEPEGLEENILRFNNMLDACEVTQETRDKMYYGTMARIHNIDVSKYLPKK